MNITIITNTFKRELDLVERSLKHSLVHESEISNLILIDQNIPKMELSTEITESKKFVQIPVSTTCVSVARNRAPIPKGTDWIIFCDDDGYIADDYIEKFKTILNKNPELEIIAGSIVRDDNFEFYSIRHKIGGSLKNFRHTKLLMGSNFAVKASTFKKLGGFDENFGAGGYWGSAEETDFCWKAYFSKVPMEFYPELIVYHIRPYALDLKHSANKAFKYGIGKGALVFKWLIFKRKPVVLFELIEMTLFPIAQIFKSILLLRFSTVVISLGSLFGRYFGMAKAVFNFGKC